jgi:hypothetical protein
VGEAGRDEGHFVSGEGRNCGVTEEAVTPNPNVRKFRTFSTGWGEWFPREPFVLAGPMKGQHILNPTEAGLLLAAVLTNFSHLWWIRELWFDHE